MRIDTSTSCKPGSIDEWEIQKDLRNKYLHVGSISLSRWIYIPVLRVLYYKK